MQLGKIKALHPQQMQGKRKAPPRGRGGSVVLLLCVHIDYVERNLQAVHNVLLILIHIGAVCVLALVLQCLIYALAVQIQLFVDR